MNAINLFIKRYETVGLLKIYCKKSFFSSQISKKSNCLLATDIF